MPTRPSCHLHCGRSAALAALILFGLGVRAHGQDWPQWRGPLGQGTTAARNLPPAAGSSSLKVLWKTAIPGEGCSSPVVKDGRVYVTTAYAGSQPHAWDAFAFWVSVVLAPCVAALALAQVIGARRDSPAARQTATWSLLLGGWTIGIVALAVVVLAKPRWFWRFTDAWTGTTEVGAELGWVESLRLRPVIVLACGSLPLIFAWLSRSRAQPTTADSVPGLSPQARWLNLVTLAVTIACSVLLGLIAWQPGWFFAPAEPWLAWLVTGGIGVSALAASVGWLGACGRARLLLAGAGLVLAGWLFCATPADEFGEPLSLLNRLIYLAPAVTLILMHAWTSRTARAPALRGRFVPPAWPLAPLLLVPAGVVFVRANYLLPQTGIVRAVVCLDAADGAVLWHTPVFVAPAEKRHSLNSQATPTPACDGERVYAYFGSALAALDTDGRVLWLQRDDDFAHFIRYGAGSSVVLADDRIIIYRDSEFAGHGDHLDDDIQGQTGRRASALIAHDKATGAVAWSITPPFSHDSYMTPLVWTRDGEREVVIATWKTLAGFALADGTLRWSHAYPMQQIVPSPAVHGDCLIVTGGNRLPCPIVAVRAPSSRNAAAQTLWSNRITGGNIVSPVCWGGLVFAVTHLGILSCRDAESGQMHWTMRLTDRCLASLVAGDGKVYALDQHGTLHVVAADTTETLLAMYALDEHCSATPAIAAGALFVRTAGHVCRIGSGD